jgi:hypothetical protein
VPPPVELFRVILYQTRKYETAPPIVASSGSNPRLWASLGVDVVLPPPCMRKGMGIAPCWAKAHGGHRGTNGARPSGSAGGAAAAKGTRVVGEGTRAAEIGRTSH